MTHPPESHTDEEARRGHEHFAPRTFDQAWELFDSEHLGRDQDGEMLSSAFAQRSIEDNGDRAMLTAGLVEMSEP